MRAKRRRAGGESEGAAAMAALVSAAKRRRRGGAAAAAEEEAAAERAQRLEGAAKAMRKEGDEEEAVAAAGDDVREADAEEREEKEKDDEEEAEEAEEAAGRNMIDAPVSEARPASFAELRQTFAAAASAKLASAAAQRRLLRARPDEDEGLAAADGETELLPPWARRARQIGEEGAPLDSLALDPRLLAALRRHGIQQFFPVQRHVIPVIARVHSTADVLVSAPTGSGKTLAYVLPILHALRGRVVTRLRALVVLPSRDLAAQVLEVFERFCPAVGLAVGGAIGLRPFADEQSALVEASELPAAAAYSSVARSAAAQRARDTNPAYSGRSRVDVLVATPGRLKDHLDRTAGFTLQHLLFLVVDEADRLLTQHYQGWLAAVHASVARARRGRVALTAAAGDAPHAVVEATATRGQLRFLTATRESEREETEEEAAAAAAAAAGGGAMRAVPEPLQRLLFSATLSHNPKQLAAMRLRNPILFTAASTREGGAVQLPATLRQTALITRLEKKPLALLALLRAHGDAQTICFASSIDKTHRLSRLLQCFGGLSVAEFSSALPQSRRSRILRDFRQGAVRIVVCSDAMARGLDIEGAQLVVNYDAPPFLRTYVHRVGRTARAGRAGEAVTLLVKKEVRHFRAMLRGAAGPRLSEAKPDAAAMAALTPQYERALEALRSVMELEARGLHDALAPVAPPAAAPPPPPPPPPQSDEEDEEDDDDDEARDSQ